MEVSAILTGVVYHPLVTSASLTKEICGMFEIVSQDGNEVVIMGDFNTNMLSSKARTFSITNNFLRMQPQAISHETHSNHM